MGNCCAGTLENEKNDIILSTKSKQIVDSAKTNNNFHLILRMQSVMRSYLAAKKARRLQQRKVGTGIVDNNPPPDGNYMNEVVEEMYNQLGPYDFNMAKNNVYDETVVMKGWRTLDSGDGLSGPGNQILYQGEWDANNGLRHGKGTQIWPDGSRYDGYWRNDRANGPGRLIHADGDVYQGDWEDDKAHGWGQYMHLDGSTYEGYWEYDKQHGRGKEKWPDGAEYEGDYLDGKKHGFGRFTWSDRSQFEGQFVDNNIQGQGVYLWADGRRFEGGWMNNKMEGYGVFEWADGRRYEGEYRNDK